MMAGIFIILLLSVVLAWSGHRRSAIGCFAIMLTLSAFYFYQDISTHLNLQL